MRVERLDLGIFRVGARQVFADKFGRALAKIGFAVITHHGIQPEVIEQWYAVLRKVFDLPVETLMRYRNEAAHHETGYVPFGQEYSEFNKGKGDLKHMWNMRRTLPPGHPRLASPHYIPNVWPHEVPEFEACAKKMFGALDRIAFDLLQAVELHLRLPADTLTDMAQDGETLFRAIHYPTIEGAPEAARSWAHTDINLITLLIAGTQPGLEVQTVDGEWIPVNETPGSIVVNVGDMLELFLRKRFGSRVYPSTMHRVVNPPASRNTVRYSAPFFVHARGEVVLDPATGYTVGEFLHQRLVDIGVAAA